MSFTQEYSKLKNELTNDQLQTQVNELKEKLKTKKEIVKKPTIHHNKIGLFAVFITAIFILSMFAGIPNNVNAITTPTWSVENISPSSNSFAYDADVVIPTFECKITIKNNDPSSQTFTFAGTLYCNGLTTGETDDDSKVVASGATEEIILSTTYDIWSVEGFGQWNWYWSVTAADDGITWVDTETSSAWTIKVVDYVATGVYSTTYNPSNNEIFPYTHTSETFGGSTILVISQVTLPTIDYSLYYDWNFYIDGISKDSGYADNEIVVASTIVKVQDYTPEYTVNIQDYSVGSHTCKIEMSSITVIKNGQTVNYASVYDQNTWYRDNAPPVNPPTITIETPSSNGLDYNYTLLGTSYEVAFTLADSDNDVSLMSLYLNNVLQINWSTPSTIPYQYDVTIDTEQVYTIKINCTDAESNVYSISRYLYGISTGSAINVTLYSDSFSTTPYITLGTYDISGLDNLTCYIESLDLFTRNDVTTLTNETITSATGYNQSVTIGNTDYVKDATVSVGDRFVESEYSNYKNIVLTNPTSTTFTNFVAYIKVTKETEMQADYDDLRFYDSTETTLLDYEVAEYDGSYAHCWVEIPSFTGSGTYTIKMLYGNNGASNAEDLQGTWDDNNIVLAMHLDTNDDSSGNSYDFTDIGDGVSYSSSMIGNGVELQGTDDYLLLAQGSGATKLHNLGTAYTILSWMWGEDDTYYTQYSMDADILSLMYCPEISVNDIFRIEADSQYISETVLTSFTEDTYAHLTTRVSGTDIRWYVDGQEVANDVWTANLNEADNNIFIGIEQALNNELNGFLDELFVISESWTDDEIEAFYEFQGNQATYVSTGAEKSSTELDNSITVSYTNSSTPSNRGVTFWVNFTTTDNCLFSATITLEIYTHFETIYTSATETSRIDYYTYNSTIFDSLSDGYFDLCILLYDDLGNSKWRNLTNTLIKDTTPPTIILFSPENRTESNPYSNLQIIPFSYTLSGFYSPYHSLYNTTEDYFTINDKTLTIDGEPMFWSDYPKHRPLIFYEGWHTLRIDCYDNAGNGISQTSKFYYEERLEKDLIFSFTSSIDGEVIDANYYLLIYLDGVPVDDHTTTNKNSFDLEIYTHFGQLLWNYTDYDYEYLIEISLQLRPVIFENQNVVVCNYIITYGFTQRGFWISPAIPKTYYLSDNNYTLIAVSGQEYVNETHIYLATSGTFEVKTGMSHIGIILAVYGDTIENYYTLLNPPSFDIGANLVYVDLCTFFKNTTYRLKMNTTWLGMAVNEGSSVWTCDFTQAGFYNFTLEIYQNSVLWDTLTTSITIAESEPAEELQLQFLMKDVDTSVSQIMVNYYTNWENTSLILFDNATQLGSEFFGEGASIWSFSAVEYYAFHNISICIYHSSVLQFEYFFSFTIQEPIVDPKEFYITAIVLPEYDLSSATISIYIASSWENATISIYDNSTLLGFGAEGSLTVFFSPSIGYHNISFYLVSGAESIYISYHFTIAAPISENLEILVWNKDTDIANGLIFVNVITNFQNCSVRVAMNSTWLGSMSVEGASIWFFTQQYAFFNMSIHLYYDSVEIFAEYFSFSIQAPSTLIYQVYFDLINLQGVGLPIETAKIFVNNSRIYAPEQWYFENSYLKIEVRDYYNNLLYNTTAIITSSTDLALPIALIAQELVNPYEIPVEVTLFSTVDSNYNHSYIIAAGAAISIRLFTSSYHIQVSPMISEITNDSHTITYFTTTAMYEDLGLETQSYTIIMDTEVEDLFGYLSPEETIINKLSLGLILGAFGNLLLNAIMISIFGALGKSFLITIYNYLVFLPNTIVNAIRNRLNKPDVCWLLENKGGIVYISPYQFMVQRREKEEIRRQAINE